MKKKLAIILALLILMSNGNAFSNKGKNASFSFNSSSIANNQTPVLVIQADVNSQQSHDNDTFLNIRSLNEVAPECQSIIKSINQKQPELNVMKDVVSSKLVGLKELPESVASNLINYALYKQTWPEVKTYYVAIDYKVKKESRWFYNGVNYRLIVLALEKNQWVIVEEAMAPVNNIVKAGQAFGTKEEKAAQNLLSYREKTQKFTDLQGKLIDDNAAKAIYLAPISGGQLSKEDIDKYPEVVSVTSFNELKKLVSKNTAIWIDKDSVNLIEADWLQKESKNKIPIVLIGYNNAIYSFREKLSGFSINGPYVDWNQQKLEPGFCIWMLKEKTSTSTSAFMKGYDSAPDAKEILSKTNMLLEGNFPE